MAAITRYALVGMMSAGPFAPKTQGAIGSGLDANPHRLGGLHAYAAGHCGSGGFGVLLLSLLRSWFT